MTANSLVIDLNLLRNAPYGVYILDVNRIITFWNRGAERILGHEAGEVVGLRCCRVLQNLSDNGTTPVCAEGCPATHPAGMSRFPPVVHVMARCASGRRKPISITPVVIPQSHCDQPVLMNYFHERTEALLDETAAGPVQEVLATGTPPARISDPSCLEATPLTAREQEVLSLIGLARNTREIANELTISINTARNHVRNVCGKLQAKSMREAAIIAWKRGLL
ncbi:MAG: LuxR C-terminal-related transcriptional regulator [Chloroflexota bacterium]|nr:LuxR C-terminal-related transcriptional regulator [Chloroflexota bacterium]